MLVRSSSKAKIEEIQHWLDGVVNTGSPGERLPTNKALMSRFQIGQKAIQAAMEPFIESGKLVSRRGLGTMIAADSETAQQKEDWQGDLLVLRRTSENVLAANLIRSLELELKRENSSVLQIGYNQQETALDVLRSLGRFKVCLLQSQFEKLSVDFLSALHRHARHIVVDGAYVTGIDVDSIGTDWRAAILFAFNTLRELGHERIAFLTSSHPARTISMARREFQELSNLFGIGDKCSILQLDALPGEYCSREIIEAFEPYRTNAHSFEFSALITWALFQE